MTTISVVRGDISKLENNLTSLSNDLEVSMAAERLANNRADDLEILVRERNVQISELTESFNKIHHEYNSLQKEYIIVKTENETNVKLQSVAINPLEFLETQWTKDRNEFYKEASSLKGSLHYLEVQNSQLKSTLNQRIQNSPDMHDYSKLAGENSLRADKIRQLEGELSLKENACASLVAQVLNLETIIDSKQRQIKDSTQQINLLRKDISRKGLLIQEQATKISGLEKCNLVNEQKSRLEASVIASKDNLIKDFKHKTNALKSKIDILEVNIASITNLQIAIKEAKAESIRKADIIKHWKDKCIELEMVNKKMKDNKQAKTDGKEIEMLRNHLNIAKEKLLRLETLNSKFEQRQEQFVLVLEQFLEGIEGLSRPNIVDPESEVSEMAKKLSKEVYTLYNPRYCKWTGKT